MFSVSRVKAFRKIDELEYLGPKITYDEDLNDNVLISAIWEGRTARRYISAEDREAAGDDVLVKMVQSVFREVTTGNT